MKEITGIAVIAGDHITTEMICPAKFRGGKKADILRNLFKDCPELAQKKFPEISILVAGDNFGGGEEPETAVRALLAGGIRCVIARSFPREFFRPAINAGLPLVTADLYGQLAGGEQICVNVRKGIVTTGDGEIQTGAYAERVARIIDHGGLINAVRKELGKE